MRDGIVRRIVKRVALWRFVIDIRATRALRRARGQRPFVLGGDCRRCARCCEAPALQVGPLVWHMPRLRRLFLWWQSRVNGFELTAADRASRTFAFRCTHFDPVSRLCDSYESRPGVCRDYPRLLLWQPAPELLPGCGYRPVARNAEALRKALEGQLLSPEQTVKIRRGLFLDP